MFDVLFQRFNNFYEQCFFKYGIALEKYHKQIIVVAFILNVGLSFGILKMNVISNADELFQTKNSKTVADGVYIKKLFETVNINENHYPYQLTDFGTGGELNFNVKSETPGRKMNILSKDYFDEINRINEYVLANVSVLDGGGEYVSFKDLCVKRFGRCVVEGTDILNEDFLNHLEKLSHLNKSLEDQTIYFGKNGITHLSFILGLDFGLLENRPFAHTFKLRYSLRSDANNLTSADQKWELEFLKKISVLKSDLLEIKYAVSQSMVNEINANIFLDMYLLAATFMLISLFATVFMSINTNRITSPGVVLPAAGIFSAIFGITSAFGFLALCGYDGCTFIYVLPFLVMGGSPTKISVFRAFINQNFRLKELASTICL
jgi:hypothetical protein